MKAYEDEKWKLGKFNMHMVGDVLTETEALIFKGFAIHQFKKGEEFFYLSNVATGLRLGVFDSLENAKHATTVLLEHHNDWSFSGTKSLANPSKRGERSKLRAFILNCGGLERTSPGNFVQAENIKNMEAETCKA